MLKSGLVIAVSHFIHKLLNRQRPDQGQTDNPSIDADRTTPLPAKANPLDWVFASAQSVGRQREHNEDALFTSGSHIAYQDIQAFFGLFIVADGMGGHVNGELASGIAVRTVAKQILDRVSGSYLSDTPVKLSADLKTILLDSIQSANQAIKKQVPGGGTTLTALLVFDQQMWITHVGDSRAYYLPGDGSARVLTRDHSFVQQLVDLGQISSEDATVHPQRNILSMALGQWEPLEPDILIEPVPDHGHLLLCSDGLWSVIPNQKIIDLVTTTTESLTTCQKLVEAANQAGGPDNITAILIKLPGASNLSTIP